MQLTQSVRKQNDAEQEKNGAQKSFVICYRVIVTETNCRQTCQREVQQDHVDFKVLLDIPNRPFLIMEKVNCLDIHFRFAMAETLVLIHLNERVPDVGHVVHHKQDLNQNL